MDENYVLNTKGNGVFNVMIDGRHGICVGQVTKDQVREAAKFVRQKYHREPSFYLECSYGWLIDTDGNHYEIVDD